MLVRPDDHDADIDTPVPPASLRTHEGRRGPGIGGIAVLAVIAVQVIVPTIALLLPPPQRFGFQMYSGVGANFTATIVQADGGETQFDATEIVGKLRPEINWLPSFPEALCAAVPEATRVHVEQGDRERTVECD